MNLAAYADLYRQHLTASVLPFWLRTLDPVHGGYFSCVDRTGQVYDPRKYIWMQGRAVWTFARLWRTFEPRPEYRAAADSIFAFLDRHALDGEPRAWFSTTADGRPAFFQRKPYSAVFVALAYAEYFHLSKDPAHLATAVTLFDSIQQWIADPSLLGRPALPGSLAYSQLADHMVVALLALELMEHDPHPRYAETIRRIYAAVKPHWDPARRLLLENASPDPAFAQYPEGRLVCPGSILEVSWFLWHALDRVPDPELSALLPQAILGALEFGWDWEYGGLYYFMDRDGRPAPALEANMKLWWPHTEALYALVLAATRAPGPSFTAWHERVHDYTWRTFVDPIDGEWFGYCDRRGAVASEMKGGAYKCAFHVPRALLFSIQAIERARPA